MDLYEAIHIRRDIRQFRADDVPDEVLVRILDAMHHAGSVGFMQPWNFTVVRDAATRRRIAGSCFSENQRAAANYTAYLCLGVPAERLDRLRLEQVGWQSRSSLGDVVYSEQWNQAWKPIAKSSAIDPPLEPTVEEGKCPAMVAGAESAKPRLLDPTAQEGKCSARR